MMLLLLLLFLPNCNCAIAFPLLWEFRYAPDLYLNKVSGASAGAIAAACLLCDAPLGELMFER